MLLGGYRQFCILLGRRELRSHVPLSWHNPIFRLVSWMVVAVTTLFGAYAVSPVFSSLVPEGITVSALVGERLALSYVVARKYFLRKALAGQF